MTCIGQRKPAILPEYVHMLCTHQSVQQNFSVRSKSYSAVYFDSRGYFTFMDFYSTAEAFFMLRLLLVYILKNAECKKYISFMMKKSEKSKKMKKYIDKIK